MSDLSGWSTLPDNVIANILSFCLPFECINTCKADPRRLLPNVIRTKTPAITQDTGPAILNRLLYANLKRVIDRSNICAARSFSGGDIMGTLESLHLSMISKDSTKIFTSCFGTSWPFNMLIAGAYIHQAVLGITLPDDLDHNRSTRDQLDLYVTTKSALDVRTALMHDLDLVLTATSNGHLYRNNRAIQQIEHYVVMPCDGSICKDFSTETTRSFAFTRAEADKGRKICVEFTKNAHDPYRPGLDSWHNRFHGERSPCCDIETSKRGNVLYEPRLSGFLSNINMIVLRDSTDHPIEDFLIGLDLECLSSVYLFGGRWSIPAPMETFFGTTRFNSSHYHYQLGRENQNQTSNRVAVKYLKCLWEELNKPLDQTIACYNSKNFTTPLPTCTINFDGTVKLPHWYKATAMTGDKACVLFSKPLDNDLRLICNITAKTIRGIRDSILLNVISNLKNGNCLSDPEFEAFRNVILGLPGYDPISTIQCHNGVIQSCNLKRLVKCHNMNIQILNVPVQDLLDVLRELPSEWSDYNSGLRVTSNIN